MDWIRFNTKSIFQWLEAVCREKNVRVMVKNIFLKKVIKYTTRDTYFKKIFWILSKRYLFFPVSFIISPAIVDWTVPTTHVWLIHSPETHARLPSTSHYGDTIGQYGPAFSNSTRKWRRFRNRDTTSSIVNDSAVRLFGYFRGLTWRRKWKTIGTAVQQSFETLTGVIWNGSINERQTVD